jgi:nicotinamidase/pyrazinamidase
LPIFATRDWHPEKTSHFQTYGGVWPAHCVQGTRGAEFHADLKITDNVVVVSKGMMPDEDSYSGFQAADLSGTRLAELLGRKDIRRIVVGGLATDYCVKHTVLDGLTKGFQAVLLADAIRAVNLNPNDGATAIDAMVRAGAVKIVDFENIPSR